MEQFENPHYEKIMVVDDSKIDCYVVELVIKKTNFAKEVIKMESGLDALTYISSNTEQTDNLPGLILLDISMPEMNGFEFMDKFVSLPESVKNGCSIMLLTSSIHPVDIERASNNKYIIKFINKPLNAAKLKNLQKEVPEINK